MEARRALLELSQDLEESEEPGSDIAAAKCIMAALSRGHELEAETEAIARIRLGKLLLDGSDNVLLAKASFDRALVLLAKKEDEVDWRRQAWAGVASCYRTMGNLKQQKQALRKGEQEVGGSRIQEWKAYFKVRIADALSMAGEFEAASMELDSLKESPFEARDLDVAAYKLQVALASGDLTLLHLSLEEVEETHLRNPSGMNVYCLLMRILAHQRFGNTRTVQKLLDEITCLFPLPKGYLGNRKWLPPLWIEGTISLVRAIHGCILGEVHQAVKVAMSGLSTVDDQLQELHIGPNTKEGNLDSEGIWKGRIWLVLRFNFLQALCISQMTITELANASQSISSLELMVQHYPVLLHDYKCHVKILRGLLHHSCMEYDDAIRQFQASRAGIGGELSITISILLEAISALCQGVEGQTKALDLLQMLKNSAAKEGMQQKILQMMVESITLATHDEHAQAKKLLNNGLKLAHTQLLNQQFTAQVLNLLAMTSRAQEGNDNIMPILQSASTLSRRINDTPLNLQALHQMQLAWKETNNQAKAAECQNMIDTCRLQLQEEIRRVRNMRI